MRSKTPLSTSLPFTFTGIPAANKRLTIIAFDIHATSSCSLRVILISIKLSSLECGFHLLKPRLLFDQVLPCDLPVVDNSHDYGL